MSTVTWSPTLTMDSAVVTRIVAAIRAANPVETAGLTDGQAAQVWAKLQVIQLLANYEPAQTTDAPEVAAEAARLTAFTARTAAEVSVRAELATDITIV
jgi:hypothetical protein